MNEDLIPDNGQTWSTTLTYAPPSIKKYRCDNGHTWEGLPTTVAFTPYNMDAIVSNPLCWYCIIDMVNKKFSAKEIE